MDSNQICSDADTLRLIVEKTQDGNEELRQCVERLDQLNKDLMKEMKNLRRQNVFLADENAILKKEIQTNNAKRYSEGRIEAEAMRRSLRSSLRFEQGISRKAKPMQKAKLEELEGYNETHSKFSVEKKCQRCAELETKLDSLYQESLFIDKLDPNEVESAFKQIRRQFIRKLKEEHSKVLELELNCMMISNTRDSWRKYAEKLSKENKRLCDRTTWAEQNMRYLENELQKLRSSIKSDLPSQTTSVLGSFRQLIASKSSSCCSEDNKPRLLDYVEFESGDRNAALRPRSFYLKPPVQTSSLPFGNEAAVCRLHRKAQRRASAA